MSGRSDAWVRPRAFLALCSVVGEASWTRATAWRAPVVPARVRGVGTGVHMSVALGLFAGTTLGSVCVGVGSCLHSLRCSMYRGGGGGCNGCVYVSP